MPVFMLDRRERAPRRRLASGLAVALAAGLALGARPTTVQTVQFVFTSDAHYGLTKATFQGREHVDAQVVNRTLVARINALPASTFPRDGGLRAGEPVGAIDFIAEGGDITNRAEVGEDIAIQPAATSWAQFERDYLGGLTVESPSGARAPLFIVPGNHEVSNAIGFYRPMAERSDRVPLMEIYNRMMSPATPRTAETYSYDRDRVLYTRDVGGIHLLFLTVWPDTPTRHWIDADLSRVSRSTPVFIVTHDQPEAEAKHFTNPNGGHDINSTDQFENLLRDRLADGTSTTAPTILEQRGLEDLVRRHPNITAYFHGNSNWNQFYDWTGPDHRVALHTFRVDSPMKGAVSALDETRLSFQVATVDMPSRTMTVRECLWNADPLQPTGPLQWGASTTVALQPRP